MRDAVPRQELAELVRPGRRVARYHLDQLEAGAERSRPLGQELADERIQVDLGRAPGLVEVVVDLAEGAGLEDDGRGASIAPGDEQRSLGGGVDPVGPPQKLAPVHPGHPLIGHDQRDFLRGGLHPGQRVEARPSGEVRDDLVVPPEAPGERVEERAQGHGIVVEDHYRRSVRHPASWSQGGAARIGRAAGRHQSDGGAQHSIGSTWGEAPGHPCARSHPRPAVTSSASRRVAGSGREGRIARVGAEVLQDDQGFGAAPVHDPHALPGRLLADEVLVGARTGRKRSMTAASASQAPKVPCPCTRMQP